MEEIVEKTIEKKITICISKNDPERCGGERGRACPHSDTKVVVGNLNAWCRLYSDLVGRKSLAEESPERCKACKKEFGF